MVRGSGREWRLHRPSLGSFNPYLRCIGSLSPHGGSLHILVHLHLRPHGFWSRELISVFLFFFFLFLRSAF